MAAITTITRYQGVTAVAQPYASTSTLTLATKEAGEDLHICYASLTGAMTINATLTKLQQFQKVFFHFTADTTARVVTFGTGFINIAAYGLVGSTLTVPISKNATVCTQYDGTSLRITSVISEGRGVTTESPAYAASIEVTDQSALSHLVTPAQLTGALTLNATAVTKHITGDEFTFHFSTDGTQRIVTFGTNFLASGTVTIPANKTATCWGFFNGTKICIGSREISA
jgi:hypothetical protein